MFLTLSAFLVHTYIVRCWLSSIRLPYHQPLRHTTHAIGQTLSDGLAGYEAPDKRCPVGCGGRCRGAGCFERGERCSKCAKAPKAPRVKDGEGGSAPCNTDTNIDTDIDTDTDAVDRAGTA